MEKYYCLDLPDNATPAFVTFTKPYYGTREDIAGFVAAVEKDEACKPWLTSLISLLRAADTGETPMTAAQTLFEERHVMENFSWTHLNIWDCPYRMHFDRAEILHIWLNVEGSFVRCLKAKMYGLVLEGSAVLQILGNMLWGLPHALEWDSPVLYTRLAEPEKYFESESEAQADHAAFLRHPDPDFTEFCNDIFGDG